MMFSARILGVGLIFTLFLLSFGTSAAAPEAEELPVAESTNAPTEHPNGWTHRPVLEHFTGLSCPPCMSGAHPDAMRLWEEEGYAEGNPWNYVEFHELNGGGEDELMTDDSRERMRYYQPGVAGTPDLEADGGYVQLGGSHGSTADANYDDMKQALIDSGERDAIKMVNVNVGSMYDGTYFKIMVEIEYVENNELFIPSPEQPLPDDTLNGLLHVFMIEDNVTAWSKSLDEYVTTHNVFREYGMQDKEFQLEPGESLNGDNAFYAEWEVPTTMIIDGEEVPIQVPVNPANVIPVAVVYDLDDTSSGRGDGSENNDGGDGDGTPRALNSATPASTAYDLESEPPTIELMPATSSNGNIQINAQIDDDSGELAGAYVAYRAVGDNDSQWNYKPLSIEGEECHGDVCTLGSGEAYAVLNIDDSQQVEYSIMAYDGNWTMGQSEITIASVNEPDEDTEIPIAVIGGLVTVVGIIGFAYWANQPANKPDDILDAEQ